jgi:transcription elongation factor Elf1
MYYLKNYTCCECGYEKVLIVRYKDVVSHGECEVCGKRECLPEESYHEFVIEHGIRG